MELKFLYAPPKAVLSKTLRIMKLTAFIFMVACLQVSASGFSQRVSLSMSDAPLDKVFQEIKKQTGYSFIYTKRMLQEAKMISVNLKDVSLEQALEVCLQEQPFSWSIIEKTVIIENTVVVIPKQKTEKELLPPPIELRGKVMNENGEPLPGASIKINGTNWDAVTNEKGDFNISNITAGAYTVVVSYVGYTTKTATVKMDDGTVYLNFKLTPSLVNLDEMTVTSTLSKRLVRSYPGTIAEIKGKELENRNLNNIANVLESVPGIILTPGSEMNNSGNIRQPYGMLIRGTNAGAPIKYLVDGVDIVSEGDGTTLSILQTLDPNDISKIEVLKGPMASTLYGSGAGGGVISITTKRGKQGKTHANFKTMFTQYANDYANYSGYNQNYSLNISGGSEQFNYLLGAGYNLYPTTKLTDINNGIDDKTWSYTAKIGGKVKNILADLSIQYGNEKRGIGSTDISYNKYLASIGFPTYTVYPPGDQRYAQRNFLTGLHLSHTITSNWYQDLTIGYNLVNMNSANYEMNTYDSTYSSFDQLNSKVNARYFTYYDHHWSKDLKSSITAGFEYDDYETRQIIMQTTTPIVNFFSASTPAIAGAASIQKYSYSSTGYFAEIVTGLKNTLFLTTGIRFDVNPAYGDNIHSYAQPRVGLSYVVESGNFKMKPRIVWGVSSTPPNPTYKITTISINPLYTLINVGNPDIKPQRSEGYEFGADLFYGNNYSFNVTYYDQKVKDMFWQTSSIDYSTSPITYYYFNRNVSKAINRGLEVSAKAALDPITLDISYTQTVSKWGDKIGQDPDAITYPGAPFLSIPKKSIFARLSYKIPSFLSWTKKGGNISLDWRYNGSNFYVDEIHYNLDLYTWLDQPDPKPAMPDALDYLVWQKGYSNFNLRADYSITNQAALYIDIQNLLDKQGSLNGQSLYQFPGRRINFGFNINF